MFTKLRATCLFTIPLDQVGSAQNYVKTANKLRQHSPTAEAACLHQRPALSQSLGLCRFFPERSIKHSIKIKCGRSPQPPLWSLENYASPFKEH